MKYGSLKSNVCWRSSVIDMPAITASTWLDWRACTAASKPSWRISTSKPWSFAIARSRSMSMPTSSPFASVNSNGANVVSVPIT